MMLTVLAIAVSLSAAIKLEFRNCLLGPVLPQGLHAVLVLAAMAIAIAALDK
jgi:hypothetical protein